MDSTTKTAMPAQAKPRRRRWWLRGLAMGVLLLLGVSCVILYSTYSARIAWSAAEADADSEDPDWRMQELNARRRVVPKNENSALHIIAIVSRGGGVRVENCAKYETLFRGLTPTAQLNDGQQALIRTELGKIAEPLGKARMLKDLPYGRFPVTINLDYFSTLIPDHYKARDLIDWLRHDAYLRADEGQTDLAVESCQAMLNAARAVSDEPFTITHLLRVNLQFAMVETLERVMAQGEASDENLERLQVLLMKEISESNAERVVRGERAGIHMLFDGVRTGKLDAASLRQLPRNTGSNKINDWIHEHCPSMLLRYYPEHLHDFNRIVKISKMPHHQRLKPIEEIEQAVLSSPSPVATMLKPALNIQALDCSSQAVLRSTWVALACERFRLKQGHWPDTLDVLVKEKLIDAIPIDPHDGAQLRFRRTNDGFVVCSISTDLIDQQGRIDRQQHRSIAGYDIGFRLWNPPSRRQPAIAALED